MFILVSTVAPPFGTSKNFGLP